MTSAPSRILFITSTRIGDVVLSSGLVGHLAETKPGARFTIAGGATPLSLFADTPGLERLLPVVKRPHGGHWLALWRETRGVRWDQVIDLRGSLTGHFLRARSRHRLGPQGRDLHRVKAYAQLLGLEAQPPAPGFFVSTEREARIAARLEGRAPLLALAPAANWVGKTWPAERFAALAAGLTGPTGPMAGATILLLGGPEDAATVAQVASDLPGERVISVVGEPDLLDVYAMLGDVRLFVGNDSGMMHLAAAAGAPTLGLFGPSDDRLYAPWGEQTALVRAAPFAAFKAADPDLNQALPHMDSLDLATVQTAAVALLQRTEPTR